MSTHSSSKRPLIKSKPEEEKPEGLLKTIFIEDFFSAALKRQMKVEIVLPPWYKETPQFSFPVLILNDGQLVHKVKGKEALLKVYNENVIPPMIIAGIHAHNRLHEYGVAGVPDYKSRGNKAGKYSRFMVNEFLPLLKKNFRVLEGPAHTAIAGFSLGGLSAFDISWNYPHFFGTTGVFSGSFWWRSKSYDGGYDEASDRIIHKLVRGTDSVSNQRFWFQCGTEDELSDRNNNGVIDSIEDTLDLIDELQAIGYEKGTNIEYVEVEGGRHDEETWSKVFPDFLIWAFGRGKVRL
ncbi:MAG: esterase family protein [Bacteroidetes bacterium]|nr:esterase family protein [Bacteroidota bacterium]